jgi:hypothetical protein
VQKRDIQQKNWKNTKRNFRGNKICFIPYHIELTE